mgnify:CR=1 FL=1
MQLIELDGDGQERKVHEVGEGEFVLGRLEGDLTFPEDEFISRRHARLLFQEGICYLKDLGSSNGTFVKVAEPTELQDGNVFLIGHRFFKIRLPEQE